MQILVYWTMCDIAYIYIENNSLKHIYLFYFMKKLIHHVYVIFVYFNITLLESILSAIVIAKGKFVNQVYISSNFPYYVLTP